MTEPLKKIAAELTAGNIAYSVVADTIQVELPNGFGILEIHIWRGDEDSIELLGGDFHTHGDIEASERGVSREKAIREMIEDIFSGKLLLIEEKRPGEEPRRIIRESLDHFKKWLPAGATYKIFNET